MSFGTACSQVRSQWSNSSLVPRAEPGRSPAVPPAVQPRNIPQIREHGRTWPGPALPALHPRHEGREESQRGPGRRHFEGRLASAAVTTHHKMPTLEPALGAQ